MRTPQRPLFVAGWIQLKHFHLLICFLGLSLSLLQFLDWSQNILDTNVIVIFHQSFCNKLFIELMICGSSWSCQTRPGRRTRIWANHLACATTQAPPLPPFQQSENGGHTGGNSNGESVDQPQQKEKRNCKKRFKYAQEELKTIKPWLAGAKETKQGTIEQRKVTRVKESEPSSKEWWEERI